MHEPVGKIPFKKWARVLKDIPTTLEEVKELANNLPDYTQVKLKDSEGGTNRSYFVKDGVLRLHYVCTGGRENPFRYYVDVGSGDPEEVTPDDYSVAQRWGLGWAGPQGGRELFLQQKDE